MSDIDGAVAPGADAPELQLETPNPISTEDNGHPEPEAKPEGKPEKPEKGEPEKPISTREALQKAREKVEKDNTEPKEEKPKEEKSEVKTEPKPDDKTEAKPDKPRDETGKFAAKDDKTVEGKEAKTEPKPSYTAGDPPTRFSADTKAVWATLPENVRGEVTRMERELTQGYEKHRASAEAFEGYRELDDVAKQYGKKGSDVFREYYNMEQMLQKDLVGGLDNICQRLGVSLKDVAAHVMGQTPDQNASAQDATIRELKAELAELKKGLGSVTQTFQKQQETSTSKEVEAFAAMPEHSRFDELAEDIAFFLKTRTNDLSEAYKLAERLNPAPAQALPEPAASSAPAPDLSAQTEKGQKSINGSPSPGSTPAARQPSTSIKESLKRAMAQAS